MKIKHQINRAKRISHACRNHGSCAYCRRSRTYNSTRRILEATLQIKGEA